MTVVGYVVLGKRADPREGFTYHPHGQVWPHVEDAEAHAEYWRSRAAQEPERFGDIEYSVAELSLVEQP